ncbi:hypothetical protein JCM19233_2892 [Vibrio astriarenae]|nr:hypothetical protein JCM19233_2892 [Vibrio sp. C7]
MEREDKQYDNTVSGLAKRDNTSDYYAIGAVWQLTGKTQGEAPSAINQKTLTTADFKISPA